ncbi:Crp/Fnr family transcriptional regulator [Sphingomonas sinipercae]|uniref:Crp/Fnr family transcriptional regulator n=1 Tax=Sphingomonas sinipercae TaxID=2714944 RepID=A0A6G7ZMZ4_9SPHN|nr:Crp/Fnr family transcriptional regulator [Sphingomonas sinipercae]QIL02289.1 Crp/Fnr family transcriptional regulator [Sphingomonas sinipercae]
MRNVEQEAIGRFLDRLLLRSPLTRKEQEEILALEGFVERYAAHRDIVSPGERVKHACLIGEGLAGRFDQMADGRRQITAFQIAGDMSDLLSVVIPMASWSITALSQVTVFRYSHEQLNRLITTYPGIAFAFWRDTAVDGSLVEKWVGNLGRKNAQSRVAHLFCEMGMRMEAAGLGSRTSYAFPVTQEQLADAVGLTPVHTNRVIQELRAKNRLTFRSGQVEMLDFEALAGDAEFDPSYLILRMPGDRQATRVNLQSTVREPPAPAQ